MSVGRALGPSAFGGPVLEASRDLLGKVLVTRAGDALPITEVEAYGGPEDLASHARSGPTDRNRPMFGPPGHWYVYLCYGIHWMLNVVTGPEDQASAVLLRGAVGVTGPGRLTKRLGVTGALSGCPMTEASGLWIEDRGFRVPRTRVRRTPRIGVDYAGAWARRPYRFLIEEEAVIASRER